MIQHWMYTMTYRRGDVILCYFPNIDLETVKQRPALVVQDESIETEHKNQIVACITSKMVLANERTCISVKMDSDQGKNMGLLTDSVVMAENLATIDDQDINKRIGVCRPMADVDQALRSILRLPIHSP